MNDWKQAWWLTRSEWSKDRYQWLWSAMFMIYVGAMGGVMLYGQREESALNIISDSYFLLMIPFQGFIFSRRSFRYIQEDSYTQMLTYYRRLPISAETVMWGRIQQALLAFIYNGIFYYGALYVSVMHLEGFRWDQYLAFALTCTGYGVLITGFYIFGEFLHTGKKYLLISMLFVPVIVLIAIFIRIMGGNGLQYAIEISKTWGLLSPFMWGSLILGFAVLWLLSRLTLRKLSKRDLS